LLPWTIGSGPGAACTCGVAALVANGEAGGTMPSALTRTFRYLPLSSSVTTWVLPVSPVDVHWSGLWAAVVQRTQR
jgi:hypothetical protein